MYSTVSNVYRKLTQNSTVNQHSRTIYQLLIGYRCWLKVYELSTKRIKKYCNYNHCKQFLFNCTCIVYVTYRTVRTQNSTVTFSIQQPRTISWVKVKLKLKLLIMKYISVISRCIILIIMIYNQAYITGYSNSLFLFISVYIFMIIKIIFIIMMATIWW